MSSIGSSTSTIISFRGDQEVDLEEALNILYVKIQQNLNYSQSTIRELAATEERGEDFIEAAKIYFSLDDYVDTLLELFSELKQVSKDVLGRPGKEHREEYKRLCDERKERKIKEKAEKKAYDKLIKQAEKLKLDEIKE